MREESIARSEDNFGTTLCASTTYAYDSKVVQQNCVKHHSNIKSTVALREGM